MLRHFFFETMTGTVIRYALMGTVIMVILLWLWAGGWNRIQSFVAEIDSPLDVFAGLGGSYQLTLPGQPAIPQGPDISGLVGSYENSMQQEDQLTTLEERYEALRAQAADLETFGQPSPLRGSVRLSVTAARSPNAATEYLTIQASQSNRGSVSLAGWSIMSLLSKQRMAIPLAASPYVQGVVNSVTAPSLAPGEHAVLVSGLSPVGVSFRENVCSGYLSQQQTFEPPLTTQCPDPSATIALTAGNLERYGPECIDYAASMQSCRTPLTIPLSLPPACRIVAANAFSYNGCVDAHRHTPNFHTSSWRLYLGAGGPLWNDTHDVIRLLDAEGRTVDALVY